jgi:hypothetical protein
MSPTALALLTGLFLPAGDGPGATEVRPRALGRLEHPAIREASGIVASRRFPGIFWVHNDSGNPPVLFAVRRDGSLVREYVVAAPNVDWEDIAADASGHLYIGEIGNNEGRLPLRAVYRLDEPDPFAPDGDGAAERRVLKTTAATFYKFPPGGRFDAEGLVVEPDGRRGLVIAKTFDGRDAEVYALQFDPPAPLLRPALPEKVGTLRGFNDPVTGASLSPGGRLAACSYGSLGVFERDAAGGWRPIARRRFRLDDEIEAVAWDGDDLILAGERRGVWRVTRDEWSGREAGQGPSHGR